MQFLQTINKADQSVRYYVNGKRVNVERYRDTQSKSANFDSFQTTETRTHWRHYHTGRQA